MIVSYLSSSLLSSFTFFYNGHYEGLPPQGQLIAIILGLLLFLVGYGIYLTFGAGKEDLKDAIDEHAKMHELVNTNGYYSFELAQYKLQWDNDSRRNITW